MYSVKKENGFVMYNDAEESRNFKIPESNFMGLYTAGNPKAMLPEQILAVDVKKKKKFAQVIVPDDQLSLAIGKSGQNARLAARLTNWKIDIKSETQFREMLMESQNEEEKELE